MRDNTPKTLIFPVSLSYRSHWSEWEAIRELVQELLDTNSPYGIVDTGEGLCLWDSGPGMKPEHLLLGESQKGPGQRGQFGEGVKIACLVLLRLGYTVYICSPYLRAWVSIDNLLGKQVMKINYFDDFSQISGNFFYIHGYRGDTFEDRFVQRDTKKILFQHKYGQIIAEDKPRLYVKDIYVQDLPDALYSYNFFSGIQLEESRKLASQWDLEWQLGTLWSYVDSHECILNFLSKLDLDCLETRMKNFSPSVSKNIWASAWESIYGNAVLSTLDVVTREAAYRGAVTISVPNSILSGLKSVVPTDIDFLLKYNCSYEVKDNLTKKQQSNLLLLKKILKFYHPDWDIKAAVFKNDTEGLCSPKDKVIHINVSILDDKPRSLSTLIHEMAHISGVPDATTVMINRVTSIAASIILNLPRIRKFREVKL